MAGIRTVALDKTGTVTKGEFRVQAVQGSQEMLTLCASLEQHSNHPIAVSIVAAAQEQGLSLQTPEALEEISGCGIRGTVAGRAVLCGNGQLLERYGIPVPAQPDQKGTVVLVAVDSCYAGYISISDTLKPDAAEAVAALSKMGIHTVMLTGDRQENADAVAAEAGISEAQGSMLPEEKLAALQKIRQQRGNVMFVGDGINDAPVLAGADVGAAMGSGADAAIEAADVVYMTSAVAAIPESLRLARRTR